MVMEIESIDDFTLAEAIEMKKLFERMGKEDLNPKFYQDVAHKFNNSVHRRDKCVIMKWEQVQEWFQDLRSRESLISAEPTAMEVDKAPQLPQLPQLPNNQNRKSKAVAAAELSRLQFEAKSMTDLAWYDVGSFLSYRHTASGELEARVRYAKFGNDHDEWCNVTRCIRERSIPLEASGCEKVKIGDLVMCFRETEERAVYMDAHVIGIQRNKHDEAEVCTCTFVVRYDDLYDVSEDGVRFSRLCVRPPS